MRSRRLSISGGGNERAKGKELRCACEVIVPGGSTKFRLEPRARPGQVIYFRGWVNKQKTDGLFQVANNDIHTILTE